MGCAASVVDRRVELRVRHFLLVHPLLAAAVVLAKRAPDRFQGRPSTWTPPMRYTPNSYDQFSTTLPPPEGYVTLDHARATAGASVHLGRTR